VTTIRWWSLHMESTIGANWLTPGLFFNVEFQRAVGLRVEAHTGDRSAFEWGEASLTSSHRREWLALIAFCEMVLTMAFWRGLP